MKSIFSLLFLLLSYFSYSQAGYFTVAGKVINAETKVPMAGASVFAQNTLAGTATDNDGNFKLTLQNGGYDLIITFTGFNTEVRRISSSENTGGEMIIEIRAKEKELAEVSIVSTTEVKDGWQQYGRFFLEEFIGKSVNSANCTIRNPEVLKFFFSKRRNRLKVLAQEPLLIENKALGYNIKYTLDSFTHEYSSQVSLYTGYPLFDEMVPANEDQRSQWDSARGYAYKGSILHFMRSLYEQQLNQEGFEIQFVVNATEKEIALPLKNYYVAMHYNKDDSTQTVEVRPNQDNVGVIYRREKPATAFIAENPDEPKNFQFSILAFAPGKSLTIERNGYYFNQNEITIRAYWTWDKIADLLPYDYNVF
jgi:hypothetical protein